MTDGLISTSTLLADLNARTLSGLLVPFGEQGNTNLGKFTVEAGVLTLPRDPSVVTLNIGHDREIPVGRATVLAEHADGIHATFSFANTDEADEALLAYDAGTRGALSVEAKNLVIRAGKAIAGHIFGAAVVAKGAFPSATLMAADIGEEIPAEEIPTLLEPVDGDISIVATEIPETVTVTAADNSITFTPNTESETLVIPNTLQAGAGTQSTPALSVSDIGGMLYAMNQGTLSVDDFAERLGHENGATLFAALSDVKYDGVGGIAGVQGILPQWMGLIWSALNYRQQVLPLFGHKDLTSLTLNGFKWTQKPAGGDWAGNKAAVPSNTLTVAAVTGSASRYAVGHDIAREFVDFPVPGFFESYADAVTEDYAKWADAKVAAAVLAGATALAGDALTTLPGASGGTIGSAASAIIDGATVLVTNGVLPSFALVAPALWKQMAKQPKANVLGYLNAALGLSEGDLDGFVIRPSATVTAGKVLVGAKEAATVYELPGVPIRIDALDLAKGGIDKAAFGYAGVVINDATGLQLVTAATV
ncbi:hypothetical protein QMG83_14500 [Salinibacterium sp. G-O1]|uniref:phage major capsid protein n=1 Tax=Salinibacterium sp. G-O1 TaxID=3046208 RepID=UPI0024BB2FAE|nr:hypothetical protein [Salinibacterium sp. G-O1]MDJ0336434.1 hypothetical protein [Salinibacterium sp. G-O1]